MACKTFFGRSILFILITGITVCFTFPSYLAAGDSKPLKIALLPIIDALPYFIAETEGDFKKAGIEVKMLPVMSGLNRDQLMQAGEVDGMLNELTTVANFNRNNSRVKAVYTIRSAHAEYPMFRLVASPRNDLNKVSDLKGASIGISKNTIIEYMTDRLLQAEGLDAVKLNKRSIPAIPERFQLLLQGQLDAVVLPDPLGFAALASGARLIIDDSVAPQYSSSILTFSDHSINNKAETLRRFLAAWDNAAARLNKSPESYRTLMLRNIRVPKNVQKSYRIPRFSQKSVPGKEQWDDVMKWMVGKKLLKTALSYDSSITDAFLPIQP